MTLSEHDEASLLTTFSLLAATISYLISPNQHKSFLEDVKSNILSFSPFRSGATAIAVGVELIGCKLLNLVEIHVGLALLALNGSPPDLGRGFWSRFVRRAFLIVGTLPLCMMLLASANDRWIQVFATTLVAEAVLADLLAFYWVTSYQVCGDWPRRVLLEKSVFTADHPTHDLGENESKANEPTERNEHGGITSAPALRDNLCDRVHQVLPPTAKLGIQSASHTFPLENTAELRKIFDSSVPAQWTCGHWRCLIYTRLHSLVRAIWRSWSFIELASTSWLLHCELRPMTLQLAGKLLEGNLLNGLLSMLYDVCSALLIVFFAYIASILLRIRLFTPLFTSLSKRIYILQRLQQKFHDLAETSPITHKLLKVLWTQCMTAIPSYYCARALVPRITVLTKEKLSYIIVIIAIPTIYISVYWLVCGAVGLGQAPSNPESHPGTGQYSEPNVAPDSNCQRTQDAPTTVSRSALSDEKGKVPEAGSEFPQTPKEVRLAIFRLAILVPTMTVWIFFYR